eukprot:s408_g7.t1
MAQGKLGPSSGKQRQPARGPTKQQRVKASEHCIIVGGSEGPRSFRKCLEDLEETGMAGERRVRAGIPEDVEGTLDFALFSIEELKTAIRERGDTPLATHCRQSLLGGSGPHRALGRAAKAGADFAKAPRFLRTGVRRAFVLALQAVRTADVGEGLGEGITPPRAWTLFLLTPRLLLARTGTDGAAGPAAAAAASIALARQLAGARRTGEYEALRLGEDLTRHDEPTCAFQHALSARSGMDALVARLLIALESGPDDLLGRAQRLRYRFEDRFPSQALLCSTSASSRGIARMLAA